MIPTINTDQSLINKLEVAASGTMSVEELREQKISFIAASLPDESNYTHADIARELDKIEGTKAA